MPSHKTDNRLKGENPFQLHYFPEIPLNDAKGRSRSRSETACFQPACYAIGDEGQKAVTGGDQSEASADSHPPDIEQQGFNRGFLKGEKAGLAAAGIKLDEMLTTLSRILDEARRLKASIREDAEKEVVELALAVARKIVHHEVQVNRNTVVEITKAALQKVKDRETITVKMNPADYHYLNEHTSQMIDMVEHADGLSFVEDPAVDEGGCLIETDCGDIDARIERQFQIIAEAFRTELKNAKERQ